MLFTAIPVVVSLVLSFYKYDNITPAKFVGLENYKKLLGFHYEAHEADDIAPPGPEAAGTGGPAQATAAPSQGQLVPNDPKFWQYLGNTLFLMLGLPITMLGALLLAMALNKKLPGTLGLRTVYYLPSISPLVALGLLWLWIFNPQSGLVNYILKKMSMGMVDGPNWLFDMDWAKPAFIIISVWCGIGGFTMLLYLAALQGIPRVYYEASEIDGASRWQRFRHITWPLLGPVNFFIIVMGVIGGFQAFGLQYVMTQGGPAGTTTTVAYYIFDNAFTFSKMGYASAVAWVVFFLIFVLTLAQWRYRKRYTFQYD